VNPVTSSSRIDIVVHTGEAEWWQIVAAIGPLVVFLGVVLFIVIRWLTTRHRTASDGLALAGETRAGGSEWWPRARWALEATLSDNPARQEVGLAALKLLNDSSLTGKEESLIIAEAWKRPLRDQTATRVLADKNSVDDGDAQDRVRSEERVIVRAARLRLSTDKKQGIDSPSWVKEIAKRPLNHNVSP
jgi:hypothetical protein